MKEYFSLFKFLFKYMFKRGDDKGSKWLWLAYGIILIAFGFIVYAVCSSVAMLSVSMQMLGLLPEFITLILFVGCIAVIIFGLIPMINYLYFSKDTEFMLALPIKPSTVFMAKLTVVYITEIIVSTLILIPCMLTIGITLSLSPLFYIVTLFSVVTVPAIPMVLVAIIAIPLMYVVSYFKNKGSMTSIILILLFGGVFSAYYFFISKLNFTGEVEPEQVEQLVSGFIKNFTSVASALFPLLAISRVAVLSNSTMFGSFSISVAVSVNLLIFVVSAVVLFALAVFISSAVYKRGARSVLESGAKKTSEKVKFKQAGSAFKALLFKEWRELFRTHAFAFQCLAGIVLVPIIVVFMGSTFSVSTLEGLGEGYVTAEVMSRMELITTFTLIGFTGMLGVSTNSGASTCITREGKNFYFAKMIPVPYKTQVNAKLTLYVIISSLTVVLGTVASLFATKDYLNLSLGLVFLLIYNYGYNCLCVLMDLSKPKLDWVTHNEAVKNNKNSIIPMFINMAVFVLAIAIPIVALLLVQNATVILIITWLVLFALAIAVAVVGHILLKKNTQRLFERINT